MLLVETILRASPLDGVGLFTSHFMPVGMAIWERDSVLNASIDIATLPEVGRAFIWKYAWIDPDTGCYILDLDDSRFINHADVGVLTEDDRGVLRLTRDLHAGEEITWFYDSFDRSWYRGPCPAGYTECSCGAVYRYALRHTRCPKCNVSK